MVLDMHLAGQSYRAIAAQLGISRQRVRQMLLIAKRRLYWRVYGIRPDPWVFDHERQRWSCE